MPLEIITSPHNPRIRHLRRVRSAQGKKETEFLLEGRTLVREAQAAGWDLEAIFHSPGIAVDPGPAPVFQVSDRLLQSVSDLEHSPGMLALARKKLVDPRSLRISRRALLLDGVQDPGNVGTLLRSAAAFGCDAVLSTAGTAHFYNAKVVRAAMGAIFHVQLCEGVDAQVLRLLLKSEGATLLCADAHSGEGLEGLSSRVKYVLALGHETGGISEPLRKLARKSVRLAMAPAVESLNTGVAGSILLYQLATLK